MSKIALKLSVETLLKLEYVVDKTELFSQSIVLLCYFCDILSCCTKTSHLME